MLTLRLLQVLAMQLHLRLELVVAASNQLSLSPMKLSKNEKKVHLMSITTKRIGLQVIRL
jgi:hypothetical protein